ncbi:unnamed protein product [Scytosiphon promiscuus]
MRLRVLGSVVLGAGGTVVTGFATPAPCGATCKAPRWPRSGPPAARWHLGTRSSSRGTNMLRARQRSRKECLGSPLHQSSSDSSATRTAMCASSRESSAAPPRDSSAEDDWWPPASGEREEGLQRATSSSSSGSGSTATAVSPDGGVTAAPTGEGKAATAILPLVLLNGVTVLWGTQHAVIKLILQEDLSPGVTNFARFAIAALMFSPWTPGLFRNIPSIADLVGGRGDTARKKGEEVDVLDDSGGDGGGSAAETWRAGAELGVWMFLGFAFQSIGLGFTTASRSAFLLYLNVKLVPFFAFLLEGRSISTPTWISAFLAFVGTVLLSSDGTPPNVGDLWSVLAASTSAMFILRLEKYSGSCDASRLNSANLWITSGLCGVWAAWEVTTKGIDVNMALEGVRAQATPILYLAVVTTALTNWMQAVGQKSVPAERAAVIYAMDPVYAAGFAYLLLGETLGPAGLVGAAIITGAALWSQGRQMGGASDDDEGDGRGGGDGERGLQG